MRRRLLLSGGLMVVVLTGCGGSSAPRSVSTSGTLDTSRVARAIQASILSQRHLHASVSCPKGQPLRKDWHFVCLATIGRGQTPFVVTETDNRGSTSYVGK